MWMYAEVADAADGVDGEDVEGEVTDPRLRFVLATEQGEKVYARGMRTATTGIAMAPVGLGAMTLGGLMVASGVGRNEAVMFAGAGVLVLGSAMMLAAPPVVSVGLLKARKGLRMRGLDASPELPWLCIGLYTGAFLAGGVGASLGAEGSPIAGGMFLASYVVAAVSYSQTVRRHHANPVAWVVPLVGSDRTGLAVTGAF